MVKEVSVFMPLLNYCHHFLEIYYALFLVVLLIGVEMEREEAHMTSEREPHCPSLCFPYVRLLDTCGCFKGQDGLPFKLHFHLI